MGRKSRFDKIIKDNIIAKKEKSDDSFGYCVLPNNDKKFDVHVYDLYYSNREFDEFCNTMKNEYNAIYDYYARGKGSELVGTPPKMASVASSSRFCYLSLRNATKIDTIRDFGFDEGEKVEQFEFEKDLVVPNVTGTNPQMDAFIETDETVFFFEFKCHEIFDNHKKELSLQYQKPLAEFDVTMSSTAIPYASFGIDQIKLFDLKQFITHILGIINYDPDNGKRKVFSYVYFKPKKVAKNLFNYEELTGEIRNIFNSTAVNNICTNNQIELRLYYYENDTMNGFEEEIKPKLILKKEFLTP